MKEDEQSPRYDVARAVRLRFRKIYCQLRIPDAKSTSLTVGLNTHFHVSGILETWKFRPLWWHLSQWIDSRVNLPRLRAALKYGNVEWERHVLERLVSRAVLNILRSGECIEDYPHDYPFPSGLFFGWHGAKPLHVVAALEETSPRVYIITAYEPDLEHFENDFRTRRKK